jgi:gamma-glutamyltranspeptidase/glutathione hydrolase
LAAALLGCGGGLPEGEDVPAVEILDLAAADEPRAALIGRDVMAEGGNAADAAVAMALAMTVTLPTRVGLGGGGVCLVHDPRGGEGGEEDPREASLVEAWDFLPRGAGGPGPQAAVPGMLRGLFAVQGAYGELRWARLVARSENLARFGSRVSRALAEDLRALGSGRADGPAFDAFRGPDGAWLGEAERVSRPDYADALGRVRGANIGGFYEGDLAEAYARGVADAGLSLDRAAVSAYRPRRVEPITVAYGRDGLHFAPPPEAAGPALAATWESLVDRGYADLGRAERLALLAAGLAGAEGATLGASAVAISADETAVACGFTLGGLFGTGRIAGETGIPIGAALPPGRPGHGGVALLVNRPLGRSLGAFAGADAAAALLTPLAERLLAEETPAEAMAAPRAGPRPEGPTAVEAGAPAEAVRALRARGLAVETVPALGRGLMIDCVWDRGDEKTCRAAEDPRAHGLAAAIGG